jgi:PiT family inorganic phosphate transporter
MDPTLWAVVAIALFFDFTNGFHDTANSIATSVSTRALSPRVAVVSAAVLNFAGAFVSIAVAATIAKGIVDPSAITSPPGSSWWPSRRPTTCGSPPTSAKRRSNG